MAAPKLNRYSAIIERIFFAHYQEGAREVEFTRDELVTVASELGIVLPKNLGDIIYSFRYRTALPTSVTAKAPEGEQWIIQPAGRSSYRLRTRKVVNIVPAQMLAETKIPDATPGIVTKYALGDEQALLAKLRYNRLVDIFTGTTCYSMQNHLRTFVPGLGQVETDELYIGVDRRGVHYVFPVQAKGGRDKLGVVQIEQDIALARYKFPSLICRSIAAQFMASDVIAMFEFEKDATGLVIAAEKHYRLVPPEHVTESDLHLYRYRPM